MSSLKALLFSLGLFCFSEAVSATPLFNWVTLSGGPSRVFAEQTVADGSGNTYVVGEFEGTAAFGAGNLTSQGGRDIYVAKFGPDGLLLWARSAGGGGGDTGSGIAIDSAGNSYITGSVQGLASFGLLTVTATGGADLIVAKYDSSGNPLWVQRAGGSNVAADFAYGYGVGVDSTGNCYVTGSFYGTSTFGTATLTSAGDYDMLEAKFNPAGSPVWAVRAGGSGYDAAYGIAVNTDGSQSITGEYYSKSITFGSTTLNNSSNFIDDIFVARYDSNGTVLWAKGAGGTGYDYGYRVAVDNLSSTYVTAGFQGTATFSGTTLSAGSSSASAISAAKYNPIGTLAWARAVVNPGAAAISSIAVDSSGNSYLSSGIDTSHQELYATKLDRLGASLWVKGAAGPNGNIYGRSVSVDANGNSYVLGELSGTVNFDAAAVSSASSQDIAMAKLSDDNGVLQFASNAYSVYESDGSVTLTVTRTGGASNAVSIDYKTYSSSATSPADFTGAASTLNFAVGQTSATIVVPIINDGVNEPSETFSVYLSNPTSGALRGPIASTIVTILDGNRPALQFSSSSYSVNEDGGSATLTVSRSGSTTEAVTVNYSTSDGTASAGFDYTATSGLLTIPSGQTSVSLNVPIIDDANVEPDETFGVTLSSPSANASLGSQSGVIVTIIDNDQRGTLQFSQANYSAYESDGGVTVTVTRTNGTQHSVTVDYATSNGTATAPSDYSASSGTLTFNAGQSSATLMVPISNDGIAESAEQFSITLTNPTEGAAIGSTATAIVTILDGIRPTGSISANPNPITVTDGTGLGITTLSWTSANTSRVEVHINSPTGNRFTATGPGAWSATTGKWVRDGMVFYLQNVTNGLPLTADNTLATVVVHTVTGPTPTPSPSPSPTPSPTPTPTPTPSPTPSGSISANPNPVIVTDGTKLGVTTLTWTSLNTARVEVHVNSPTGNYFSASKSGTWSATTGKWVRDGMTFYLQDVSNGLPLTSANTLGTIRVSVTSQ